MQLPVAPAQFIHQISQPERQLGLRVQVLLQTFADSIADGLAGPVIDLFEIVGDSGIHGILSGTTASSTSQRSQGFECVDGPSRSRGIGFALHGLNALARSG
jgi:hypothetical protein